MGQAVFIVRNLKQNSNIDVEKLMATLHAVTQWRIEAGNRIVIEYDEQAGSVEVMEEALAGLGLDIQHLSDKPTLGNVRGKTATTRGAHDENVSTRDTKAKGS
jgi:hypothetical protein